MNITPVFIPSSSHKKEDTRIECPNCHHKFHLKGPDFLSFLIVLTIFIGGIVAFVWFMNFVTDYENRTLSKYILDSWHVITDFLTRLTS